MVKDDDVLPLITHFDWSINVAGTFIRRRDVVTSGINVTEEDDERIEDGIHGVRNHVRQVLNVVMRIVDEVMPAIMEGIKAMVVGIRGTSRTGIHRKEGNVGIVETTVPDI